MALHNVEHITPDILVIPTYKCMAMSVDSEQALSLLGGLTVCHFIICRINVARFMINDEKN